MGKVLDAVGIAANGDQHLFFLRQPAVIVGQVETIGVGVQFQKTFPLAGVANDAQHVDVVGLARADEPATGMSQDAEMAVVHGAQDALGLLALRQVKVRVHGSSHQIEFGEHLVGQVECTVFKNVDLDAFQQRDAL